MLDRIIIKNANIHNLKNVCLELPKNKLIVFTGLSGSGKSSLAFDTIYAEGQRRYVESLSAYARQFLGLMQKPDVEYIEGLSPAISIDQKSTSKNPRSTVGTVTEIYDYLRLLFARIGRPYDPRTEKLLESQTVQEIVDRILNFSQTEKLDENTSLKLIILSPLVKNRKGTYEELFQRLLNKGFVRVRVDNEIHELEEDIRLDRYKIHNIELVVDRLILKSSLDDPKGFRKRLTDSVELALNMGEGMVIINKELQNDDTKKADKNSIDLTFSENFVLSDGTSFPKLEPNLFSFNAPAGACPNCSGLGTISEINPELLYNPNLTISEGAIYPWSKMWDTTNSWYRKILEQMCIENDINIKTPMKNLSKSQLEIIYHGTQERIYKIKGGVSGMNIYNTKFEGLITNLSRRYKETQSEYIRTEIEKYMQELVCPACNGKRLKKESLYVKIDKYNILNITSMNISQALVWIDRLIENKDNILTNKDQIIAKQILKELKARLGFLVAVGLDYITLNRTSRTLSGGEAQRIRLASQIGSGLSGVLYVLDEPSIGLHQKDNEKLITTLKHLRDLGNTVIVVEHDEDTIRSADWITDIGPKAGEHGGEIVYNGELEGLLKSTKSITAQYLCGKEKIEKSKILSLISGLSKDLNDLEVENFNQSTNKYYSNENNSSKIKSSDENIPNIKIIGATENNLKNIDVTIPLKEFVCVTGASGSGKSTLINEILAKALMKEIYGSKEIPGKHKTIEGIKNIDKIVNIDQSPIGRTLRSNPATYTGVFNFIRDIFSQTQEAKQRGYTAGRFSFNTKGGRCEKCRGDGVLRIEMQFMPDVYVKCEECDGKRYNQDTLEIDFKGKNIADILNMTVEESLQFFEKIPFIINKLKVLDLVGLGYIRLGQSATTLSGGEAQRVKLATELSKRQTGKTMYILDEPTTGLHFFDVEKLLLVLHSLVAKGNTVVVIEHNLDVIKTADHIIDLGPEGGEKGGFVVFQGNINGILKCKESFTGKYLKKVMTK